MDIKASDLRIGNYVHEPSYDQSYHIYVVRQIKTNGCCVSVLGRDIQGMYDYSDLKPIPLTEELLLRFGFEKSPHSFICEGFHITKQDDSDYWFMAFNKNNAYIKKIKHVHQLQNWYYMINDEELELKNPPVKDQEG